jgi:type II secretory pathway predicted ATPase ExeA
MDWRTRKAKRKLRTKANELARDAQVFATGCEYDLSMVEDAEKLARKALSVLRFASELDARRDEKEENE